MWCDHPPTIDRKVYMCVHTMYYVGGGVKHTPHIKKPELKKMKTHTFLQKAHEIKEKVVFVTTLESVIGINEEPEPTMRQIDVVNADDQTCDLSIKVSTDDAYAIIQDNFINDDSVLDIIDQDDFDPY